MVDDLTVGDAINFFSLHEAPYRPFLTYRARVALDGPLVRAEGGTTINMPRLASKSRADEPEGLESRNGRIKTPRGQPGPGPGAGKPPPGPKPHFMRRIADSDPDTED